MRWGRILRRRADSILLRSRADAELEQEVELHIQQLVKQYLAEGMTAREARLAARREFGPLDFTKEQCRDMRQLNWLEDLQKDLAYSLRVLTKSRGFTATAILSLALGIGANTIVFSVVNALLLKPVPMLSAERLYFVNNSGHTSNSFPNYRDIRDRNQVFESLFAYRMTQVALDDRTGAQRAWGYLVTGNYFSSLGLHPALGRFFTPPRICMWTPARMPF